MTSIEALDIETQTNDTYTVLRPSGDLDAYGVADFRLALAALVGVERLVVDLSNVAFMDSSGLGALVGGVRRRRDSGGQTAVACGQGPLIRMLRATGFDRVVPVAPTVGDAAAMIPAVPSA